VRRGHGGRQRGVKDVVGNGPRSSGTSGGAVAQTGESGGSQATPHCVTDRWGRAATGSDGQRRGAGGRGVIEAGLAGTVPGGAVQTQF
jgi:hypothetical protein